MYVLATSKRLSKGIACRGYAISGESLLAEEPPRALREVDRPNRNSEKPANVGGRVLEGHPRAEEISSWIQRLPYPAGRGLVTARPMRPMKLIMMSEEGDVLRGLATYQECPGTDCQPEHYVAIYREDAAEVVHARSGSIIYKRT